MKKGSKPVPVRIVDSPNRIREPESKSMRIRQIDNGFIINESGYRNGHYYDRERFAKNIRIDDSSAPAKSAGQRSRITPRTKL